MSEHSDGVSYPTRRAAREAALRSQAGAGQTPAVESSADLSVSLTPSRDGASTIPAVEEDNTPDADSHTEAPSAPRPGGRNMRGLLRWFLIGGAMVLAIVVVVALAVSFLGRGTYSLGDRTQIGSLAVVPPKVEGWKPPMPSSAAISSSDGACQFSAGIGTAPAGLGDRPVVIEVGDSPRLPTNDGDATRAYLRTTIAGFTAGSPEWTVDELGSIWVEMRQGPEQTAKTDRVELAVFRATSAKSVLYYAGHTFLDSGSSLAMTVRCNGADRMTNDEARKLFSSTTITYAEAPKA